MVVSPARILTVSLVLVLATLAVAEDGPDWAQKVHPLVLEGAADAPVEFLVVLDEQADLSVTSGLATKEARGAKVYELLTEVAARTQAPLIALLESRGAEYRSFWAANMIWARGTLADVEAMAGRDDVLRVGANPRVRLQEPEVSNADAPSYSAIEWNISLVLANQLWNIGHDGAGAVIGGQDTGYQWWHAALLDKYRGWDGVNADHDYNWHDAIHSGGGSCGADSTQPCDDHSHGTHTMGTMVGDDGGSNQIGMAPGAKWIGCRNMDQGNGTPATYTECFQWFIAPTEVGGGNPDPSKAPHVINNSWACPPSEGCDWDALQVVVENTRAAGIVVVVSAGNSGSSCETVQDPAAIYDASFSVGATNASDQIAGFSSRGPVTVDGSNRLKPDISAPGVNVRSSVPGGGYSSFNGTSMAGPHVAGLVALIFSARPDLIGNVDAIEKIIESSAAPLTSGQTCGDFPGSQIPNAVFGHGRIDAWQALHGDADGDGTMNLADCSPANAGIWGVPDPATNLQITINSLSTILNWSAPVDLGGQTVRFDVLRSENPGDFSSATCLIGETASLVFADPSVPDDGYYYLIRSMNECGGNIGSGSTGNVRAATACP